MVLLLMSIGITETPAIDGGVTAITSPKLDLRFN